MTSCPTITSSLNLISNHSSTTNLENNKKIIQFLRVHIHVYLTVYYNLVKHDTILTIHIIKPYKYT